MGVVSKRARRPAQTTLPGDVLISSLPINLPAFPNGNLHARPDASVVRGAVLVIDCARGKRKRRLKDAGINNILDGRGGFRSACETHRAVPMLPGRWPDLAAHDLAGGCDGSV
jgi:hypothetical protein